MKKISDHNLKLKNKKILLRVDFNVPIKDGSITETSRIEKIIPTIKLLIEKEAKIIIISHVGRPKGKVVKEMSLEPISKKLASLLNKNILFNNKKLNENTASEVNKIPNQDLGSLKLSDGTNVEEGRSYTKDQAEGMVFEPSENANGQTNIELTIHEGLEESSAAGIELASEKIEEKELEILSDLNQDGVTGIKLTQEIYNPNPDTNNPTTPPAGSALGDSTPPPPATTT